MWTGAPLLDGAFEGSLVGAVIGSAMVIAVDRDADVKGTTIWRPRGPLIGPQSSSTSSVSSFVSGESPAAPAIPINPGTFRESASPEGTTMSDPRFTMLS